MSNIETMKLALEALESSRVFVTTREKIKHPEGTGWYDQCINALRQAIEQAERNEFNPDWNLLEATQESLREHMAEIQRLRGLLEQAQQSDKEGSPCPEFWDWLPKAYNFEGDGSFTKYNMEVSFLAGKQSVEQAQQDVDWEKLYRLEVKKKEAIAAKYEQDIKPLTKIVPMAQQAEPVAYGIWDTMIGYGGRMMMVRLDKGQDGCTVPLYTSPPQGIPQAIPQIPQKHYPSPRQPLTDEEISKLREKHGVTSNGRGIKEWTQVVGFARAIEAAHGIKGAA